MGRKGQPSSSARESDVDAARWMLRLSGGSHPAAGDAVSLPALMADMPTTGCIVSRAKYDLLPTRLTAI